MSGNSRGVSFCQLSLPGFDGSAETFLALIADRKLAADQVPVSTVTAQFLAHLTDSDHFSLDLAGELMAASARLMAAKSSHLLLASFSNEEEEAVATHVFDPARRDRFTTAVAALASAEGRESFLPFTPPVKVERRMSPRSPDLLLQCWTALQTRSGAPQRRVTVPGFVRLEAVLSRMLRLVRTGGAIWFKRLIHGKSRNDVVVHFMALLELLRQKRVHADQDDLFADISLQWASDHAESAVRAG